MSRDFVESGLGWSWTSSRIARHIRSGDSVVLVAQSHGRIIGFAIMRFGDEEAHLDMLAVKPPYRRTGVGRRLLEWLEQSALVAGVSIIHLEVRSDNKGAQRFYQNLGYRYIRQLSGYYRGRETAVCIRSLGNTGCRRSAVLIGRLPDGGLVLINRVEHRVEQLFNRSGTLSPLFLLMQSFVPHTVTATGAELVTFI